MNRSTSVAAAIATVLAFLVTAAPAAAEPPLVGVSATTTFGQAPLRVTLAASGSPAMYRWDLGDGATAEGPVVEHVYERPAVYVVTVTAVGPGGETATAAISLTAATIELAAPRTVRYGARATFSGRVVPALRGVRVALARNEQTIGSAVPGADGEFRIRARVRGPASYRAVVGPVSSEPIEPRVRPRLAVRIAGRASVGRSLTATIDLQPAGAGRVHVQIRRRGARPASRTVAGSKRRIRLPTTRPGGLEVRLVTVPAAGFASARLVRRIAVRMPALALGSRGRAVRVLEERLAALRYVLRRVDGAYGHDTYEAVLAFQKTHGLARTGRASRGLWQRLRRAGVPPPRMLSGTRLEVDKSRQLLLEVRGGRVVSVVHVSTGATGNTPLGRWHVYRKVAGWDWVLWYPMYFLRGFAIHGYPSVPPYPASHGCVRVPMWFAPILYGRHPYGATVYVY